MIIKNKIGYSYNDLTIVPEIISDIKSRSECDVFYDNKKLPIFTAPMASVVSDKNYKIFEDNYITPIIPRNISFEIRKDFMVKEKWVALSLNEFKDLFIDNYKDRTINITYYICVDIANGHMRYLYDLCSKAKEICHNYNKYNLIIMTGNIANPRTYEYLCELNQINKYKIIDYIRCSVGSGNACLTASNTSCHYPIASLINDIYQFTKIYLKKDCPKIIADGGIRNYSDVIKALALGADYVMIGSLFAQCLESAGEKYDGIHTKFDINDYKSLRIENGGVFGYYTEEAINTLVANAPPGGTKDYYTENGCRNLRNEQYIGQCTVKFFGMASADGQKSISGEKTKTAEGLTKYLPVKYTIAGWSDNMISYLKSAMSYTNSKNIYEFIGGPDLIINSISEINAVNK